MNAVSNIEKQDLDLLSLITDLDLNENNAYNIRKDGKSISRNITKDVAIISKEDGTGIDIIVKENTKHALVMIPVIVRASGLEDIVYNDFHIGTNANVTILAGCAIHNSSSKKSRHNGIHRFFIAENANVKYVEKHYGTGHGVGHKVLDPTTEIYMKNGSKMDIDTIQIEGVDSTLRVTNASLENNTTLRISEKIMTSKNQSGKTEFEIDLNGENSSCHVVSRSVACDDSSQIFISKVNGNNNCYGHVECDGILKDNGKVQAIPEINANNLDANLVHEATIGKIAGDQLLKLMTLGLSSESAEKEIINGFLK